MRLPSRVVLPFGYVVLVKQLSDSEMRAEDADGDLQDGLFDPEQRCIYIRKSLSMGRKKYLLSHELFHALIDHQHELFNNGALRP